LDLIAEVAGAKDTDSRRRNYRLTKSGRALLDAELDRVNTLVRKAKAIHWKPAQVKP
jgi:DNA-binding PadR family transcriptional regulator